MGTSYRMYLYSDLDLLVSDNGALWELTNHNVPTTKVTSAHCRLTYVRRYYAKTSFLLSLTANHNFLYISISMTTGSYRMTNTNVHTYTHTYVRTTSTYVYSIQYTVYSIQYTVYSVQYTVYSIQYTVYSVQYVLLGTYVQYYTILCHIHTIRAASLTWGLRDPIMVGSQRICSICACLNVPPPRASEVKTTGE